MLTQEQRQNIRKRLEMERAELTSSIQEAHNEVEQLANYEAEELSTLSNHPADTSMYDQEQQLTIERTEQEILQQVDRALERLDNGTYGICEICGEPIAPERLEALPYTTFCIRCQAEQERSRPVPI